MEDRQSKNQAEFVQRSLALWRQGLQDVLEGEVPEEKAWTSLRDVKFVLQAVGREDKLERGALVGASYVFLHDKGETDLYGAASSSEEGCLVLQTQREGLSLGIVLRPERLTFRLPTGGDGEPALEWSYLWLELAPLEMTDIYGGELKEHYRDIKLESVCEVRPGEYTHITHWEDGYLGHDESGKEKPLPDTARPVMRALGGALLVAPKGGPYNQRLKPEKPSLPGPPDGLHAKLGEERFAQLINDLASR